MSILHLVEDKEDPTVDRPAHGVQQLEDAETLYNAEDMERWRHAATAFGEFLTIVDHRAKSGEYPDEEIFLLQFLFLGEKPAILDNNLSRQFQPELEALGFRFAGDYVYDPVQVQHMMEQEQYADTFRGLDISSPENLMEAISELPFGEADAARGLLLGFPSTSTEMYLERNAKLKLADDTVMKLTPLLDERGKKYLAWNFEPEQQWGGEDLLAFVRSKLAQHLEDLGMTVADFDERTRAFEFLIRRDASFDVEGFQWLDYRHSEESQNKQARLEAALDESGIRAIRQQSSYFRDQMGLRGVA